MSRGLLFFFFFNDTGTPEIYTLSLHDALPICAFGGDAAAGALDRGRERSGSLEAALLAREEGDGRLGRDRRQRGDRKSTRLNSSHLVISYAVFCLKKKSHNRTCLLCQHAVQCA